ncbi:zinc-binding dehydrogenase [Candidatus Poribacteria bacterium]|nr:zinc-binding dehydrogenase [Candidatus Poribacteria bacterium]
MKAAVLEDLEKIVVKEVETPKVDEESLLLKVKACAVCGSDIRIYRYGNPRVKPPQIIGHEIAGEVVEVGKKVKKFNPGDRVAIGSDVPCGECSACQQGIGNNCLINYAMGYQFPGGFAEYVLINPLVIKYGPIHHIPDNLDFEEAALAEPLGCCINGLELADLRVGDTVVIIGGGPAGCLLSELSKCMGATKVILSQRSKNRLELINISADVVISSTEEDFEKIVLDETNGEGADVVITACSSPDAQEQALNVIAHRGRINYFGGLPKGSRKISIDSNLIHYKECFVLGSHGSVPGHHRIALDLIASGAINVRKLITHRFPLDSILEAFRVVEKREAMKAVIFP